ncbi:11407_t:CDS:2, partial [Dentiscutata heterogama]
IEIKGENLNFLSEPVELINFTPPKIVRLKPSKTSKKVLMNSNSLIVEEQVIREDNWNTKILKRAEKFVNEAAEDLLRKAIQRCFVLCKNGGESVAENLLKSVAELECVVLNRKVSKIKEYLDSCSNKWENRDEFLEMKKKTNPICCDIIKNISSEIYVENKNHQVCIIIIVGVCYCDGFFLGLGAASAAFATEYASYLNLARLAGLLSSVVGYQFTFFRHKCEANYREIIKFLLQQLKSPNNMMNVKFINSPFHNEEALVNRWKELGYMNKNSKQIVKDMPFRTDTEESATNMIFPSFSMTSSG